MLQLSQISLEVFLTREVIFTPDLYTPLCLQGYMEKCFILWMSDRYALEWKRYDRFLFHHLNITLKAYSGFATIV